MGPSGCNILPSAPDPSPRVSTPLGHVALISADRWDDVWRRNQHIASRLPAFGLADTVTFVNPPRWAAEEDYCPVPGVTVVSPGRKVPKRLGGLRLAAQRLTPELRRCDTLWINDPTVGAWVRRHPRAVYDVTDDWRCARRTARERRRLVVAEDRLARRSRTVVCSEELRRRWRERYGVEATVVNNGAEVAAIRRAEPRPLGAGGPHIGYVGTLHEDRLDQALVLATAAAVPDGQVHLVGPDSLTDAGRQRLASHPGVIFHGAVPAPEVPGWLVAFDVLICPHLLSPFTRSLDAIKAYEYLATPRPIVATPTSGFQDLRYPGLTVTTDGFGAAVAEAARASRTYDRVVPDWDDRTREFAAALLDTGGR